MKITPIPMLEPLINDLNSAHIGYYLKSNQFKKFCIRNGIQDIWHKAYQTAKDTRTWMSFDFDLEPFDCQDGLVLLLNYFYNHEINNFFALSTRIITSFIHWSEKILDIEPLLEDFELFKYPVEYIRDLKEAQNKPNGFNRS